MKMKTRFFLILTLLIVLNTSTLPCFAQSAGSTQLKACEDWQAAREDLKEVCKVWQDGFSFRGEPVFSPDLRVIAGANISGLRFWDVSTGEIIHAPRHCSAWDSIAFSPDGHTLVSSGHALSNVRIGACVWNASMGVTHYKLEGYSEETQGYQINDRAFSPDGRTIADGYQDSTWAKFGGPAGFIRLWDVSTGKIIRTLENPPNLVFSSNVRKVAFSPDGRTLASWSGDGIIRFWDVSTGRVARTIENMWSITDLVFSPDGRTLASVSTRIDLWDVSTGALVHTIDSWGPMAFNPCGGTLASVHSQDIIRVWDVLTGKLLHTYEGHAFEGYEKRIIRIAFSSDGGTLASVSASGKVLRWSTSRIPCLPPRLAADVNGDGQVDILDLVAVASAFGETGETPADVNGDGSVSILDLVAVAAAFGEMTANAPSTLTLSRDRELAPTRAEVQQWLRQAHQLGLTDAISQRGIRYLEQLLAILTPKETMLLANYPNPFNPETWIPYQLAKPADVTVHIYGINGTIVRTLSLGHQVAGTYHNRSRAAYWDGKNELGEPVASGVYFYTLTAGDFTATRKMLIRK